jgi:hypothetical protein
MKIISSDSEINDIKGCKQLLLIGFCTSLFVAISTIITFGFAMIAIPPAGPYCPSNCMDYPFLNLLKYYPRDYLWMYCAIFQLIGYLILTVVILFHTDNLKKFYGFLGFSFAGMAVLILMADYFVQFAVVPISVRNNELEGIAILTQYNGHGIFIALEELGYSLMSLSMLFISLVFSIKNKLEKSIRLFFMLSFLGMLFSFTFYVIKYGIDRSYLYEVAAITINFLVLIINGILLSIYFLKKRKECSK